MGYIQVGKETITKHFAVLVEGDSLNYHPLFIHTPLIFVSVFSQSLLDAVGEYKQFAEPYAVHVVEVLFQCFV